MAIQMTREEYRNKYGVDPFSGASVSSNLYGQATPSSKKKKGILGNITAGLIKPFARFGTNLINAKQVAFREKTTQPFSGNFLGEVKAVGQEGNFGRKLKDTLGAGLDVASNIPLGGGITSVVKSGIKGLVKQGIKSGTRSGFVTGAMQGGGGALQENKSLGGVLADTVTGGVVGGTTGAITGGAIPLASRTISRITPKGRADAALNRNKNFVVDLVSPKATNKVAEQAIKQGRVAEAGFLSKAKILPSKRDQEVVESVMGYVSPKKSILANTASIDRGVREINRGVKEYVTQNKVPFNTKQLRSRLDEGKDELKLIFASDEAAEKTYNAVVDEFVAHVGNKDTAGLLQARQSVDKIPSIKKLLDSQSTGENVKREVVLTVRRMANRYIADLLPDGNKYKESLLRETLMIEAIENIAEKNRGMIGKNNLQILAQRYPILKWAIGGVGAGIAGGAGVGVGSTIINSTD